MLHKTKILGICLCLSGLSACTVDSANNNPPTYRPTYQPYTYVNYYGTPTDLYPQGYDSSMYVQLPQEKKPLEVPDTYLAGANHSPTPPKNVDKEWVNNQKGQSYTIQLADGEKAAEVANTLLKVPKNERTAEIKYQRDGKTYYKGVYGTYPNYEEAQKALNNLPADVKQNAGIKTWGTVQNNAAE